jgi:cytochrome c oxidase cbb3-type subunit 3
MRRWRWVFAVPLLLTSCKREQRDFRTEPAVAEKLGDIAVLPGGIGGAPPAIDRALGHPYQTNAYQLNEGKRLYAWFNCNGCHAQGGGSSGPALTDGWWRYGPDIVSILVSIRDGRLNGMPAFANKLTTEQIWQLAGYVQTMGAYAAQTAAPNRNDEMQARPSENRAPAATDGPGG